MEVPGSVQKNPKNIWTTTGDVDIGLVADDASGDDSLQ